MKANPHYWQAGKPYLDAVEFLYVDNDNQRVLQIEGRPGQHHRHGAAGQRCVAEGQLPASTVEQFPAWEVDLLVLNEKLPQFADRHVRRAITYAINRPALVHAANFGTGKPGGSFFPPSLQYYSAATPVLDYSLSKAKAELAQSKYPKGFSTKLLVDSGNQKFVTFAQIIKSQLAPLGIDVTITGLDHSAFESTFQKFDYDMFIDYAINDISDPDEMASFELDFKDGGSSSYWSSYNNPAVIDAGARRPRPSSTRPSAPRCTPRFSHSSPRTRRSSPSTTRPTSTRPSKTVKGFAVNPGGAYRLEDVWLT